MIDTFFDAINEGDKTRAYGCLSPQYLLESLTMNLEPGRLYNDNFSQRNSLVENIVEGQPIAYRLLDPENPTVEVKELENREKVMIEVSLEIQWQAAVLNTPDGKETRFAVLKKYHNGWKLGSLGTGS